MKFFTLSISLCICLTLSASIFSMESEQEKILWQQLCYIYKHRSKPIIQLYNEQRPDVEFEKEFDQWEAISISYEILKSRKKKNITKEKVIDFSLRNLGQFLLFDEYS